MKYRLVVTTDGRPDVLERTLASIDARVRPRPLEGVIVDDSGDPAYRRYLESVANDRGWNLCWHPSRAGFCTTVADAWTLAAEAGPDWVFWTEDDIELRRSVDLVELAHVLEREPMIAQMALMRQPVNEKEIAAGGVFNLYRDRYERQGSGTVTWLRSRTNFSTTTSLIPRAFIAANPWPVVDECEGNFSIDLLARGYEFGVWGNGEPWTEHFGVRSGTGY